MSKHMEIKGKLKNINKRVTFDELIQQSMLNEKEKQLMIMYYVEGKDFGYIADIMGYSKAGIAKMHKRALKKIESLL